LIEDYIGFYTKNHFWIDKLIHWEDLESDACLKGIIPEIRYIWEDEHNFKAAVTVDGLILLHIKKLAATVPNIGDPFQFQPAVEWWDEYIDFAHTVQLLLESATIDFELHNKVSATELTSAQTCTVGMENWCPVNRRYGKGHNSLSARFDTLEWVYSGRNSIPTPEVVDPWPYNYAVVSIELLNQVFTQFAAAFKNRKVIKWLSFIVKSKAAHERGDFRVSFTLAWFVIESACRDMASQTGAEMTGGHQKMYIIEKLLREKELINLENYLTISSLRKLRNKLIHNPDSTICMPTDSFVANGMALNLACRNFTFSIRISMSYSISY
jgi:uncharacterized protein YutE (UPF0331/DUF86 family)